uniref:SFRICE_040045 n=1 Tax=Spodoptera frugiperda TaxID=7108 RepID=A0A2H1WIP0_SPOFR
MFYDSERDEGLGLIAQTARKITSIKKSSNTKYKLRGEVVYEIEILEILKHSSPSRGISGIETINRP